MDDNSRIKIQYSIKIIVTIVIIIILFKIRVPIQRKAQIEQFTVKNKEEDKLGDIVVDNKEETQIDLGEIQNQDNEFDINIDNIMDTIKENINYSLLLRDFADYDLNLRSLTYMPVKYHNLNPPDNEKVLKTYIANNKNEIVIKGELLEVLSDKDFREGIVVSNNNGDLFLAFQTFTSGKTVEIPAVDEIYQINKDDIFFFVDNELYVSNDKGVYLIDIGKGGYVISKINNEGIPGEVINISNSSTIYYIQDDTIKRKDNITDANSKDKTLYKIDKKTTAFAFKDNVFYIYNNKTYQNDKVVDANKVNVYVKGGKKRKSVDALEVLQIYWENTKY